LPHFPRKLPFYPKNTISKPKLAALPPFGVGQRPNATTQSGLRPVASKSKTKTENGGRYFILRWTFGGSARVSRAVSGVAPGTSLDKLVG
jgi:hypothetical protein